jgi:hypothetical protein
MENKVMSEFDYRRIFLEDTRLTYYSRQSHFTNLSTKAGVVLAVIIGFVTIISSWFADGKLLHFKVASVLLIAYSAYLAIRVMFVKNMPFMGIDKGLQNLANHPNMETIEWIKILTNQYAGFIRELQPEYDNRNKQLRLSLYILGGAFVIYLVSLMVE